MRSRGLAFISIGLMLLAAVTVPPAYSSDGPIVLIAGDDSDPASVSRQNQVHSRVASEIAARLDNMGYRIAAIRSRAPGQADNGKHRAGKTDLLAVARELIPAKADLLVLVAIRADARSRSHTRTIVTRIEARVLDVGTGNPVGDNVRAVSEPGHTAQDCSEACLLDAVREQAGRMAPGLADAVANMADGAGIDRNWSIRLQDIDGEHAERIEEYLRVFPGVQSMARQEREGTDTEYDYRSTAGRAAIRENMVRMLNYLQYGYEISLSGNGFAIRRHVRPTGQQP